MKGKKNIILVFIVLILVCSLVFGIKNIFFKDLDILEPLKIFTKNYDSGEKQEYVNAITKAQKQEESTLPFGQAIDDVIEDSYVDTGVYPYSNPPEVYDDGSIIYEGMTVTELTNQLNKSLTSYMTNTGYFFADYTRKTGLDPYLAVAIVLLESGCKWGCSGLTTQCNNIGGLKGHGSCNGTSYSKYDTLEDGINGYLGIVYNNYYSKGLRTPEQMNPRYAESSTWAYKVNTYMSEIRNK